MRVMTAAALSEINALRNDADAMIARHWREHADLLKRQRAEMLAHCAAMERLIME